METLYLAIPLVLLRNCDIMSASSFFFTLFELTFITHILHHIQTSTLILEFSFSDRYTSPSYVACPSGEEIEHGSRSRLYPQECGAQTPKVRRVGITTHTHVHTQIYSVCYFRALVIRVCLWHLQRSCTTFSSFSKKSTTVISIL